MKIIGHRGAAGIAPENTVKAIQAAALSGADAVEFDVRRTKDGIFVLNHDATLERLTDSVERVKNLTLAELQQIKRHDGGVFATLEEALIARGHLTAVIEGKGGKWSGDLARCLQTYGKELQACVISFNHLEVIAFHELMPELPCYLLERHNAFKAASLAKQHSLSGINLNFWILNPFTYWFARMRHLEIAIYTIDKPYLMRWFKTIYPKVAITTNYPNILRKI
jgi:glycerophosphoryl diester phosphodiesterase